MLMIARPGRVPAELEVGAERRICMVVVPAHLLVAVGAGRRHGEVEGSIRV